MCKLQASKLKNQKTVDENEKVFYLLLSYFHYENNTKPLFLQQNL